MNIGDGVKPTEQALLDRVARLEQDLTECRRVEETLQDKLRRFQTILDHAPVAIYVKDREGRFVLGNRRLERFTGRPLEATLGLTDYDFSPAADADRWRENDLKVLASGRVWEFEETGTDVHGHAYVNLSIKFPLTDDSGTPVAVCGISTDISERKKAEEALEGERAFVSAVLETVEALVTVLDREGRIVSFNRACERATGYSFHDVQGRCFWDFLLLPEEVEPVKGVFARLQAGQFPTEFENYWVARDGARRFIHWTNSCLTDEAGVVTYVIGSGIDLTEQQKAQTALRQSEADLNLAQAVARTGSWRLDVPRNELVWSDEAHRIFGVPKGTPLSYETFLAAVHPADREHVDRTWQASLRGDPYDIEHRIVAGDEVKWVRERATLEFDRDGQVVGGFGTVQDITARKRTEQALKETRDYLENLIDYANAPIIVWNPAFEITRFNHAFERLTGRLASETLGRELQMLFPEERREESMARIRSTTMGERWEVVEIPIAQVDGGVRTVLWNSATLFDPDGTTPIATIAQGQDITDRKRLEDELRATAARLADVNQVKDEFLSTLSHELRTPLNAILGWSEMLLHERLNPTEVRHALEVIGRNARAQVSLVEDVLDVSRIISGKLRLAMRRVNLVESAHAALDAVRPAAEAKGVELVASVPADAVLVGDPDRLQQICWNLLSNAVKFTPRGGRVEVRVQRTDAQVELEVKDTGAGIAPEFLPHLFERFRQADSSTTRQHGGLGLGLAIVRHLVELHGGRVTAKSAGLGEGASFTVMLPVAAMASSVPDDPGEAASSEAASAADGAGGRLAGFRVLVVDDEADARDLLEHVLRGFGAAVKAVRSAQAGLEAVQQWRPDVVLADIGMPGEDGYAFMRQLRALPPEHGGLTPAAALTAYGGAEHRLRALSAGFQRHLAKPVVPSDVVELVAALTVGPRGR